MTLQETPEELSSTLLEIAQLVNVRATVRTQGAKINVMISPVLCSRHQTQICPNTWDQNVILFGGVLLLFWLIWGIHHKCLGSFFVPQANSQSWAPFLWCFLSCSSGLKCLPWPSTQFHNPRNFTAVSWGPLGQHHARIFVSSISLYMVQMSHLMLTCPSRPLSCHSLHRSRSIGAVRL